jgi:hypothetical protein
MRATLRYATGHPARTRLGRDFDATDGVSTRRTEALLLTRS